MFAILLHSFCFHNIFLYSRIIWFLCFLNQLTEKKSSKITCLKKWRERNPSALSTWNLKFYCFQNKKLIWWLGQQTSIILRSKLRLNFGWWNKTKLKFDQDIHKPNPLVLNFEEIFLFSHWFQHTKLRIILLSFSLQNRFKGLAPLPRFHPNGFLAKQKFVERHLWHLMHEI